MEPLTNLERKILNALQQDLSLENNPFAVLSKQLGIEEGELVERLKDLKKRGIIRNLSAGISHKKLGFSSTLIALRVPEQKVEAVAEKIIAYPEVTHCFLREGEFNLWSVLIYKDGVLKNFLKEMAKEVGRRNILNLTTKRQFKLKTTFRL